MEVKKVLLPVIGKKMIGDFPSWALVNTNKSVISVDYHPAFEALYPQNSKFPCRIIIGSGLPKTEVDWEEIYANIYEEDCEYEFKAIRIEEDEKNFTKKMLVQDEYGFQFYLYRPSKEDLSKVGSKITCLVIALSQKGLELESVTGGVIEDEEAWLKKELLFDKLHDARKEAFKVFNDRDFRGVWQSVIDKYPDSAHFIYELLQNADDALASEVTILLDHKELMFKQRDSLKGILESVEKMEREIERLRDENTNILNQCMSLKGKRKQRNNLLLGKLENERRIQDLEHEVKKHKSRHLDDLSSLERMRPFLLKSGYG